MTTTKKVLTANLKPGMISSEAVYTYTNHLVIQSNTVLTEEIIDKLKYYAIKAVKIAIKQEDPKAKEPPKDLPENNFNLNLDGPTYFERIQQTKPFMEFKENYTGSVSSFQKQLDGYLTGDNEQVIENMMQEVDSILSQTRNSLHLLDMLQCLRNYDDMTYIHSMNVALICNMIGSWLSLTEEELTTVTLCGLLHDIGKLKIPTEVITKPGKLTDEEFELIRSHPKLGYDILRNRELDDRIKLAALQHHERYNGSGYPRHLTGPEINQFSSIVAIADVYDAMTSSRAYRKGICPFTVIATFESEKDLYEPSLLYLFMERTIEAYVNTEVLLSNGERGKVVLLNKNLLSRPVVITDTKTYDLSKNFNIEITDLI